MVFKKILVAYDGSDLSKKALNKALELFGLDSSEKSLSTLEIIHIYPYRSIVRESSSPNLNDYPYTFSERAESIIEEAKKLIPQNANIHFILNEGDPAKAIVEYANESSFDLIVMGSRGIGGIREFILGSVSHNVSQHSKIPVLIIK